MTLPHGSGYQSLSDLGRSQMDFMAKTDENWIIQVESANWTQSKKPYSGLVTKVKKCSVCHRYSPGLGQGLILGHQITH